VHLGQQNIFQILRWRDVEVSERDVAASRRNKAQISRYGSRAVPLGEAAYSALYERRWREAKRSANETSKACKSRTNDERRISRVRTCPNRWLTCQCRTVVPQNELASAYAQPPDPRGLGPFCLSSASIGRDAPLVVADKGTAPNVLEEKMRAPPGHGSRVHRPEFRDIHGLLTCGIEG
jgi:hypothetical protein